MAVEHATGDFLTQPGAGPAAVRGGALRVAGYFGGVVLGVGSSALLFRELGVVDTGRYVTILSFVTIVGGLADAGLTAFGMRELSVRKGPARRELMRDLLGTRGALTVVGVLIAAAVALVAGFPGVVVAGTLIAGVGVVLQGLQTTLSVSLQSRLRLGWVTAGEFVRQLISAGLIVALVVVGGGLLGFVAITIPAAAAVLVLTIWLVRGDVPLLPAFHPRRWRGLLQPLLPYSVAAAAGVLYFRIAVILVAAIAGGKQAGYFGASFRIVDVVVGVPALMVGAAFPILARAARDDHARLAYGVDRVFAACLIFGAWVGLGLVFAADTAIDIVGGVEFDPAAKVLRLQAVWVTAAFVNALWAYTLLGLDRLRAVLVLNVGALTLNAALVAVLASLDGARGAAIATSTAELVNAIAFPLVILARHPDLRPSLAVVPKVAAAFALACAFALLPLGPEIVLVAVQSVVFFAVVLALGAVPRELLDAVLRRGR